MNRTENHASNGEFTESLWAVVDYETLTPHASDGPSRAEIEVSIEGWTDPPQPSPAQRPKPLPRGDWQFSLGELMSAVTFVAIGCAGVRNASGPIFAGAAGGAFGVGLFVAISNLIARLDDREPRHRVALDDEPASSRGGKRKAGPLSHLAVDAETWR